MLVMGLKRKKAPTSVSAEHIQSFGVANTFVYLGSRRTKQSGPLGELFDHGRAYTCPGGLHMVCLCAKILGVDACNTTLEVVIFAGAMNLGKKFPE